MKKFTFFRACLCCIALLAFSHAYTQTGFPTCSKLPKCVSNDLEVVGAFLSSNSCTCTEGNITATLNMQINNKTGSTRTSFAFYANLEIRNPTTNALIETRYLTRCGGQSTGTPLLPNSITTLPFAEPITVPCGATLTLTNIYLAWTDAAGNDSRLCPLDFCGISPKCGRPTANINIRSLLSATATTSPACEGQSDGSITITASGGVPGTGYTYSKDGTNYQTSNVFSGLAEGTYTLYVKDKATPPCVFSFSKTLADQVCCVTPTINAQPASVEKCSGASAQFTVGSTGGVPAPSIQWQVSTNNGGSYTDIVNGSPYSGATTGTLTVNPVATSMNGYRYRAVLTSGTCAPATSNAAILTVNAIPGAPVATYNAPACDETEFSLTVNNVVDNAIYTLKDKNGNSIAGVTPASPHTADGTSSFTFENIPAGSGYMLSVSVSGCPSAQSNNCGVVSGLRSSSNSVVEPIASSTAITKVKVAPNPYNDRIRFTLEASESGKGVLELYSIMGQKLKTVFEGQVEKGQVRTIEYNVPFSQRAMMVYVFRVGNQRSTGKLISSR